MLLAIALCVLTFTLAAASDYLETRYVKAVNAGQAVIAARASVAMWLVGVVGLVAVIEVGWWVLPGEALGLYFGTKWAMKPNTSSTV